MNYIGLDLGSTAVKVVVRGARMVQFLMPTGWSSRETALHIKQLLLKDGIDMDSEETVVVATGYGRISADFADYIITEISCHGKGAYALTGRDGTIIDVGGQDTKIIQMEDGKVSDFLMNEKCAAGTGKFVEIMSNRLGITIEELFRMAQEGTPLSISSLCTVFAESEVITYIGEGQERKNIAAGIIDSVGTKVAQMYKRHPSNKEIFLTGGLSHNSYFAEVLADKIEKPVKIMDMGRYAGALGAAIFAEEKSKELFNGKMCITYKK